MAASPLMTFMSAGYFIIVLFFLAGIIGIVRAVQEKRYDKEFVFAILSLIMGIAGFAIPGAAIMNNYILLYMAAAWLSIHGILSIISAVGNKNESGISMIATPLATFFSIGYAIVLLFFVNGVLGIVRAVNEKCYDRKFFFAILSMILG